MRVIGSTGTANTVNHDLTEERAALVARREQDPVDLLDEVEGGTGRDRG